MGLLIPHYSDLHHYHHLSNNLDFNNNLMYNSKYNISPTNTSTCYDDDYINESSFICSCCSNPVVNSNTNAITNVNTDYNISTLNQQLLINNLLCNSCHSIIGYKIINFTLDQSDLPLGSDHSNFTPLSSSSSSSNTSTSSSESTPSEDDGLAKFKNHLLNIENEVNSKVERIDYLNFIETNQQLIGQTFLYISQVTSVR
ncbi:hypothetical protein DFJ63DRAFT_337250 [Scheffersomyces coipomensis]|uniref:uncharacterized protein n=1 Tax=Scheffersomyces coipomensis TaxID=1788519 RepID=UPI00315CD924